MMLKINIPEMVIPRYGFGGSRINRYVGLKQSVEAAMPKLLKEFFEHFVRGKDCSNETRKYIVDAAKLANESDDYLKGAIAEYKDQYVIVFLNVTGLDTCGVKITYNEKDKTLFRAFMSGCSDTAMKALYAVCLRLAREKQRVRILKELETYGVIYSNFPEEDFLVRDGFVIYTNCRYAQKRGDSESIKIITDALARGVTYEEISDVLPRDIECRFLNRELSDYEKAQIKSLHHGIAAEA